MHALEKAAWDSWRAEKILKIFQRRGSGFLRPRLSTSNISV